LHTRLRRRSGTSWALFCLAFLLACPGQALATTAAPRSSEVLILGRSVSGGGNSLEAKAVLDAGLLPVIATDQTWRSLTRAEFAQYRAIVIGDTGGNSPSTFQAATDTASTWGPAVTGNQVIIGTDPVDHASSGGAGLVSAAIAFAVDKPNQTGLYVTLGDAYGDAAAGTKVPLLDGLGAQGFTVSGADCYDDAHLVARHPAVSGLTDALLSNWGCSVHEQIDTWPANFQVLAIARNRGSIFTAADGTVGTPYILAAGEELTTTGLSVTPTDGVAGIPDSYEISAHLVDPDTHQPLSGKLLRAATETTNSPIVVRSFLDCSTTLCLTNGVGEVRFSYRASAPGTHQIVVFQDDDVDDFPDVGERQVRVRVTWIQPAAGTWGPGWPHTSGSPVNLTWSYGGAHRYLGNGFQGTQNWNNAGTQVRFSRWPGSGPINVSMADATDLGDTTIAITLAADWCYACTYTNNTIYFFSQEMDKLDDFQRTYTATHELGHALGLRHLRELGLTTSTPSVMHQTWEFTKRAPYNTPQAYDIGKVNTLYGAPAPLARARWRYDADHRSYPNAEALYADAPVVITGTVRSIAPGTEDGVGTDEDGNPLPAIVHTDVQVDVGRVYQSITPLPPSITVSVLGGTTAHTRYAYEGAPPLTVGDTYALFLTPHSGKYFPLAGGAAIGTIQPDGTYVFTGELTGDQPLTLSERQLRRDAVQLPAPPPAVQTPPTVVTDRTAPIIRRARISRTKFVARSKAAKKVRFEFSLSETARVEILLERIVKTRCRNGKPGCTSTRSVGTLTRARLGTGANRIAFGGRAKGRALKPGRYQARIFAIDGNGNRSRASRVRFTIR
jgi:hypothetical protein